MHPKFNRTFETFLIGAVVVAIVVIIAIAFGMNPWLVLLLGGIAVLGIVMVSANGMSGSP